MINAPRPQTTVIGRRSALLVGAGALGAALSACSTGPSGDAEAAASDRGGAANSAGYPRTITHALGSTKIPAPPQRVATVSWANQDIVLALGVVPVGVTRVDWGGNENGSTGWFDAALEKAGGEKPAQWSETDGLDTEAIAEAQPDLIVGAYSGLTAEQYQELSKIAPVIAYPEGDVPFGTAWQDATTLVGEALGKEKEAAALIEEVESAIVSAAEKHTELAGTTFLYGIIDPAAADQISIFTAVDNRPRFLTELGMENPPFLEENTPDDETFFFTWSPERADELDADVIISWAADESVGATIAADPLLKKIPAVQAGTLVLQTDPAQVLSISTVSPLSIPWALEHTVPAIAEAAATARS